MWKLPPPDAGLDSWRDKPAGQQPTWPEPSVANGVAGRLRDLPPLVSLRECDLLRSKLAAAARGDCIVLQGGDCAERFDDLGIEAIRRRVRTLATLGTVMSYVTGKPVVTVGRMAGQYAKPRTEPTETRDGTELPAFRGDAVNGADFTVSARTPQPRRLLDVYHHSAATVHICRSLASRTAIRPDPTDTNDLAPAGASGRRYDQIVRELARLEAYVAARGGAIVGVQPHDIYCSHEALVLDYEDAMIRLDARTGEPFSGSGHLLWIGERTRALEGAHVELLRHVGNPLAVKIGPDARPEDVAGLADALNPTRAEGRLTFIARMGAGSVRRCLPPIVRTVMAAGHPALWLCDPMHGNSFRAANGYKTRDLENIKDEVAGHVEVLASLGAFPGGLHLELTADDVTECLGGSTSTETSDLSRRYESACDPRLNNTQAFDVVFHLADRYNRHAHSMRRGVHE